MKKKILITTGLLLAACCLLLAAYALQPSTKSSSGDKVPDHERQRVLKELQDKNLPTSQREARQ